MEATVKLQQGTRRATVWLLALLCVIPAVPVFAEDAVVVGVFPRRNPSEMIRMFTPLADYLSRELKQPVKLETAPDFTSFWEAVSANRYQLVHYNQYHYVRARSQLGHVLLAINEENGKSSLSGIVMTRVDSGIRTLADLRGRTIVFGGNKQAMNSYITPTYLLRQAGLKAGDYREEFAVNPPNVALGVFYKRALAGGIGDILYDTPFLHEQIDVSKLVTLAKSPPVPHLVWAVRSDVPVPLRQRMQQALLDVKRAPDAAHILNAAALSNIVAASDEQFRYVREVVAEVMGEHY